MPWSRSLPESVLPIHTYAELDEHVSAFAKGHLNLLIILGPAGVGKSRILRSRVTAEACWIDGTATPFGIYMQAHEFRDRPLVLDDVDGLYANRSGVRLLKCLCQTDPIKTVSWLTNAAALEKNGIPKSFVTTSRVAIIANRWECPNADVAALLDRGHTISFEPTPVELHQEAATWFWNQEIFDFVADHLHLIAEHSFRTYVLAWEKKQAGLDWRQFVLSRLLTGTALLVARLKAQTSFQSETERVQTFIERGHGSRATWFNHAKKLRHIGENPPRLWLKHTEPPTPAVSSQSEIEEVEAFQFL